LQASSHSPFQHLYRWYDTKTSNRQSEGLSLQVTPCMHATGMQKAQKQHAHACRLSGSPRVSRQRPPPAANRKIQPHGPSKPGFSACRGHVKARHTYIICKAWVTQGRERPYRYAPVAPQMTRKACKLAGKHDSKEACVDTQCDLCNVQEGGTCGATRGYQLLLTASLAIESQHLPAKTKPTQRWLTVKLGPSIQQKSCQQDAQLYERSPTSQQPTTVGHLQIQVPGHMLGNPMLGHRPPSNVRHRSHLPTAT
jgi:hypothetical protein